MRRENAKLYLPSLRAKRSNPSSRKVRMDCFAALAMTAMAKGCLKIESGKKPISPDGVRTGLYALHARFVTRVCFARTGRPVRAKTPRHRSVFVGGDRFHQGHQLTLYGLVLDLAVGTQQPQAERAVQEEQALDFARLAVAVVEERHRHVERGSDLLKTSSADAVDALLVLLDLLEADAELVAELRLGDFLFHTPQANPLAQFDIGFTGAALFHLFRC